MPLDPPLRVLMLAISRAARAFSDGDNAALKAVNESLQPLVDAAMSRILAKDAEIRRLTAELAAAQAGPVVEWRTRIDVEEATVGAFALLVESDGWRLEVSDGTGDYWIVDSGDETGPAGKSACLAAYRRACAC